MSRCVAMSLLAGLLFLAAPLPGGEDRTGDQEKLQGAWRALSVIDHGEPWSPDQTKRVRVRFEKNIMTVTDGKNPGLKATFKIDPSRSPKTIDLTVTETPVEADRDKVSLGIYELDRDRLTILTADAGEKDRPKELTGGDRGKQNLVILEREKP